MTRSGYDLEYSEYRPPLPEAELARVASIRKELGLHAVCILGKGERNFHVYEEGTNWFSDGNVRQGENIGVETAGWPTYEVQYYATDWGKEGWQPIRLKTAYAAPEYDGDDLVQALISDHGLKKVDGRWFKPIGEIVRHTS